MNFPKIFQKDPLTVGDMIKWGAKWMRRQKCHHHFFGDYSWLATARALSDYALNYTKQDHELLTLNERQAVLALFEKRIIERLPVEYITHQAEYCGHLFYVNDKVLVPRSIMSGHFKEFLEAIPWENYRVLDLCTGSGCIGITLALLNPKIQVDLSDISSGALEVAQKNIEKHKLSNRLRCIQSDGFENIQDKYDLVITNPPYVSMNEYNKSPAEFKNEPKIALESGQDGLDMVNVILRQAPDYLNNRGVLIAEVGPTAAKRIKKKYPKIPFKWFKYKKSIFLTPGVFLCTKQDLQPLTVY